MSIRNDYPMMFNNSVIPFPTSYSETLNAIDSVNQTEAGTDIIVVSRYGKLSVSMSFTCLQPVLQMLASFSDEDSFTFKRYNPATDAYGEKTVSMRNFNYSLKKGSENLTEVDGVWEVSFELEEF